MGVFKYIETSQKISRTRDTKILINTYTYEIPQHTDWLMQYIVWGLRVGVVISIF